MSFDFNFEYYQDFKQHGLDWIHINMETKKSCQLKASLVI